MSAAAEKGLVVVALTEHLDLCPSDPGFGFYRYEEVISRVNTLRRQFPHVRVLLGVEVDFSPVWRDAARDWLSRHTWDVVIGSVHSVGGLPLNDRATFDAFPPDRAITRYFADVGALLAEDWFDILAHIDIIRRYLVRFGLHWSADCLANEAGRVVERVAASGRYLEVNTSGIRQELGDLMPGLPLLETYRKAGGRRLVIGSDAHHARNVAAGFSQAADAVVRAGFNQEALAAELILLLV